VLKSNENISVLQALALAEGLTRTAAKSQGRIIRSDEQTGARSEIPLNLGKILAGKAADPVLRANDIVFVPNSAGRLALYRGMEAALSVTTGLIIWRR
jgi:polysaccharide export outer membrane protein